MSGVVLACLLDEDLDQALPLCSTRQASLASHVRSRGRLAKLGVKNGPLLEAMAASQLRVLVTGDRAVYAQRRARLMVLHIGVVLVRDPARAADRIDHWR